ncbi:MAG: OmpH family outer membrane protein [Endozoicomonas sp.]
MKQIRLAFLALIMLAPFAHAATKIAVVDSDMVLRESDAGKRYIQEEEKKYAPRIKLLQGLQEELQTLEESLKKDAPMLSQGEIENRQLAMKRKYEDLQLQDRQMRMERSRSVQAEMSKLQPKVQKAIDEVSAELGYDMTLERGVVRYVKSTSDITRPVIERMNKLK